MVSWIFEWKVHVGVKPRRFFETCCKQLKQGQAFMSAQVQTTNSDNKYIIKVNLFKRCDMRRITLRLSAGSFKINQAVPVLGFQKGGRRARTAEINAETLSRLRENESQHQRAVDTEDAEGNWWNSRTEGMSQKQPRVKGSTVGTEHGAWIQKFNLCVQVTVISATSGIHFIRYRQNTATTYLEWLVLRVRVGSNSQILPHQSLAEYL